LNSSIAFIGAGNMSGAIIGGLVKRGYPAALITATGRTLPKLEALNAEYGVNYTTDNEAACAADIIVIGVKPQMLQATVLPLRPFHKHKPLIISVAAGIPMSSLEGWMGEELAIVRCMPNTPSLVQVGASGLFANAHTSKAEKDAAEHILSAVGIVEWLKKEDLIDAVIAVSGSGPAYYFMFMEAMIAAGIAQGLTPSAARELTIQTALGAASLAQQSDVDVSELRRRVMSPGGTTEQAVFSFEQQGLAKMVATAMARCADRAQEMAAELGNTNTGDNV